MTDHYQKGQYGRALVFGVRTVRKGGVTIGGDRFVGECLLGLDGQRVELEVHDDMALQYRVYTQSGTGIGIIKYRKETPPS